MQFDNHKSIYLQLVDMLCEQILTGKWPPDEKIPSVRDMGMLVQVNPNTVLRAYDLLQQNGIVFNKRGIGYFVDKGAVERILEYRREDFFQTTLPTFFKTMHLLKVTPEEVIARYTLFQKKSTDATSDGSAFNNLTT
ncbi:MAG: HTH-type transcriptional repressor YtrA [Bacteroidetes bacterium ADurb.Bin416]|jgi:DNA-binding transcriptional regulator YhcF (GntR family)|nr:MAG: HTH-type transcriptional repressor YtrA [Bacteroidetes bacterium ADurb.Bin416]